MTKRALLAQYWPRKNVWETMRYCWPVCSQYQSFLLWFVGTMLENCLYKTQSYWGLISKWRKLSRLVARMQQLNKQKNLFSDHESGLRKILESPSWFKTSDLHIGVLMLFHWATELRQLSHILGMGCETSVLHAARIRKYDQFNQSGHFNKVNHFTQ